MNNNQKEFTVLDLIGLGSAGLGVYNTILNQQQLSNDELFKKIVEDIHNDNDRILEEIKKYIDTKEENYGKIR